MSIEKYCDVILAPVVTEKSTAAAEGGRLVFQVASGADKMLIRKAVETLFGVKVKSVNTMIRKGKVKRFRGIKGRRPDAKRAVIDLEPGSRLVDPTEGLLQ